MALNSFFVACYAILHPALSVRRFVGQSVRHTFFSSFYVIQVILNGISYVRHSRFPRYSTFHGPLAIIISFPVPLILQKSCYEPPPPPPVKLDKSARRELADGADGVVEPGIGDALHTNASVPQVLQPQETSFWVNLVILFYIIVLLL